METNSEYEMTAIMGGLYGDGIITLRNAFPRIWVEQLRKDIEMLFEETRNQPGGLLERGPDRYYAEIHPERLRGFLDIVNHPWFRTVCRDILGADYKVVEVGFDIPGPGAQMQPWHRDFPSPEATWKHHRLNSLAFNITTVDVTEDLCPLEFASGTQWDDLHELSDEMFPPPAWSSRYKNRSSFKLPKMGDLSARTALAIHRGTANRTSLSRPMLVVGVDAPDARNGERHDMQLTRDFEKSLSPLVLKNLHYRVVPILEPIVQVHDIEGLRMGGS